MGTKLFRMRMQANSKVRSTFFGARATGQSEGNSKHEEECVRRGFDRAPLYGRRESEIGGGGEGEAKAQCDRHSTLTGRAARQGAPARSAIWGGGKMVGKSRKIIWRARIFGFCALRAGRAYSAALELWSMGGVRRLEMPVWVLLGLQLRVHLAIPRYPSLLLRSAYVRSGEWIIRWPLCLIGRDRGNTFPQLLPIPRAPTRHLGCPSGRSSQVTRVGRGCSTGAARTETSATCYPRGSHQQAILRPHPRPPRSVSVSLDGTGWCTC
jgi:hypothetical protein